MGLGGKGNEEERMRVDLIERGNEIRGEQKRRRTQKEATRHTHFTRSATFDVVIKSKSFSFPLSYTHWFGVRFSCKHRLLKTDKSNGTKPPPRTPFFPLFHRFQFHNRHPPVAWFAGPSRCTCTCVCVRSVICWVRSRTLIIPPGRSVT